MALPPIQDLKYLNTDKMEKTYLKETIDGALNLYHVTVEFDDRNFVVAIQGGIDFEKNLSELVSSYWAEFLQEGSIQMLEHFKDYENNWQAETIEGALIYIEKIDLW